GRHGGSAVPARVVAQHLEMLQQVRELRRPHIVIATQGVRERQHRLVGPALKPVEQARVVYVGKRQGLLLPAASGFECSIIGPRVYGAGQYFQELPPRAGASRAPASAMTRNSSAWLSGAQPWPFIGRPYSNDPPYAGLVVRRRKSSSL